jgi:hypothetical protein
MFKPKKGEPEHGNAAYFGTTRDPKNQLARSLALLLAGEVLGGTDGDVL